MDRAASVPATARYPKLLEILDAGDREWLAARATRRLLGKGQLLYRQGDESNNLFILESGVVKVHFIQDSGGSLTASYYRAGMLVGAHGCTEWAGNHIWSAQALVDCRALCLRRVDLVQLVERSASALRCVLAVTEFKAEQLRKVIRILATPTLEARTRMALQHLGSLYGIERGAEIEIDGRFTHQEIAEMVGASRQSVTMTLLVLERHGQIRRDGRRIFIPGPLEPRFPGDTPDHHLAASPIR
jgi:CRP-like cAMP-binding protein